MPFLKNISRYILLLILCALTIFSCDRQHDDLAFTNPIDPDNPETHGDPYNLRVDAKDDSITVQWDKDQLTDVDGFVVYRSTSPDGGFQKIGTSTSAEYDDTDAPPGVTYYYQVSAYRGTEDRQTVPSPLTERSHGMIKARPVVRITSRYEEWESGALTVAAEASDVDGSIQQVRFEYSLNGGTWDEIFTDTEPPYSVEWDTTSVIGTVDDSVWVKAIATDNDGLTAENAVDTAFGVDNEPPAFLEWHRTPDDLTEDTKGKFRIQVKVTDGDGSGLVGSVSQMDYHIGESTSYDECIFALHIAAIKSQRKCSTPWAFVVQEAMLPASIIHQR